MKEAIVLDGLIREGRMLLERISKDYERGFDALPPEERITIPEIGAWYEAVTRILEQQFGTESSETRLWREGLERMRREAWEGVGIVSPLGGNWVIHNLSTSLGLLAQIKLLHASSLPTYGADSLESLHPVIAARCRSLFSAREYDAAIFAAFRAVEEALRGKTGASAEDVGVALVSSVLNPKSPRLRLSTIAAEQEADHALFRGALGAFKNPLSHREIGHGDPAQVVELLALASLLMRLLDDASDAR
jgi:uncharacterized protein (TIGR02391 family)